MKCVNKCNNNKKIYNEQLKFITEEGYVSLNDIYKIIRK